MYTRRVIASFIYLYIQSLYNAHFVTQCSSITLDQRTPSDLGKDNIKVKKLINKRGRPTVYNSRAKTMGDNGDV